MIALPAVLRLHLGGANACPLPKSMLLHLAHSVLNGEMKTPTFYCSTLLLDASPQWESACSTPADLPNLAPHLTPFSSLRRRAGISPAGPRAAVDDACRMRLWLHIEGSHPIWARASLGRAALGLLQTSLQLRASIVSGIESRAEYTGQACVGNVRFLRCITHGGYREMPCHIQRTDSWTGSCVNVWWLDEEVPRYRERDECDIKGLSTSGECLLEKPVKDQTWPVGVAANSRGPRGSGLFRILRFSTLERRRVISFYDGMELLQHLIPGWHLAHDALDTTPPKDIFDNIAVCWMSRANAGND